MAVIVFSVGGADMREQGIEEMSFFCLGNICYKLGNVIKLLSNAFFVSYALSSLEIEKDHLFPVTRGNIF